MKKGYYSMLNKRIKQMKTDGKYIIDRQELTKDIDLSEEDPAEKDTMLANLMVSVMLYQNDYRSVIKGQGVFIDSGALKSKIIANTLVNNSELDVKQRTAALKRLQSIADDLPDDDCMQMNFDSDDNGNIIYYENMTKQELIDLIIKLQENTAEGD